MKVEDTLSVWAVLVNIKLDYRNILPLGWTTFRPQIGLRAIRLVRTVSPSPNVGTIRETYTE